MEHLWPGCFFLLDSNDLSFASTETKFKNPITKTQNNFLVNTGFLVKLFQKKPKWYYHFFMKKSKNKNIILGFSFWIYEFGFSWCKGKIINLGIFHTYSFFLCLVHQKGIDRCNEGGWLALQSYVPGKKVFRIHFFKILRKGQLISKCHFDVFNSSKKWTSNF